MDFLTLNLKGTLLALLLAFLLVIFGLGPYMYGGIFVAFMLVFLLLAAIVTKMGKGRKKREGVYERLRGTNNVLANGLPPVIFAFLFWLTTTMGFSWSYLFLIGFMGSVASITADKFSSEIGVLDGAPRQLIGLKKVRKGVSGGVTWLGFVAGFFGAIAIALVMLAFPSLLVLLSLKRALVGVAVAGFAGTFFDSILGYYESKGTGTKHTTNFFSSVVGGLAAMAIYLLLALL
jgi:uncharacterized protein (TIGR00297 family)